MILDWRHQTSLILITSKRSKCCLYLNMDKLSTWPKWHSIIERRNIPPIPYFRSSPDSCPNYSPLANPSPTPYLHPSLHILYPAPSRPTFSLTYTKSTCLNSVSLRTYHLILYAFNCTMSTPCTIPFVSYFLKFLSINLTNYLSFRTYNTFLLGVVNINSLNINWLDQGFVSCF